jgi:hypothetical protein
MDMIGRSTDKSLQIFGVGSSADWPEIVNKANADSLKITQTPDGLGASDHSSFYSAKIPVLHYFTGTHSDYHRPSDDAQFINYPGTALVLKHVVHVVRELEQLAPDKLAFTTAPVTQRRNVAMRGPTLGVLPDYGYTGKGFRITGTSEGKLGEKLGLKAGDILTKIDGRDIKDIYDYMESLNTIKVGAELSIEILRDGKAMVLKGKV